MNNNILLFMTALHSALGSNDEKFRLDLTRNNNSLDVVLIPQLNDDESKIPEDAKQIRAALAMPLVMRGMSLDTLSNEFAIQITGFGEARQSVKTAYDELLANLKDAKATAKNKTPKKSETAPKAVDDKTESVKTKSGILDF